MKFCKDCKKEISLVSTRCKSCSNKNRKGKFRWNDKSKRNRMNGGNPMWKGNEVGYNQLHNWIRRRKPKPNFCDDCRIKKPYDLANISGEYKRDVNDFKWLCRKCHMKNDGRLEGLKERNRSKGVV